MKVYVADLKPGMVLSKEVKGANGRLLLPCRTELTEQHLRIFNIWGVSEVEIREDSPGLGAVVDEEHDLRMREMAVSHADGLFAYADMDVEPMQIIKEASIRNYVDYLVDCGQLPLLPKFKGDRPQIPSKPYYESVGDFMDSGVRLSSFSEIYYKIIDALDDPSSTSSTLADIISKDSGLSAKLISLVNSPLYGFNIPVESLSRAVSLVGTSSLSQLALSVSVMDSFKGLDKAFFSMADFWKHSLACGVFCRIISSQVPGTNQDNCFVSGMLHDLGRLAMLQLAPERADLTFRAAMYHGVCLNEMERSVFGFDHCQLAEHLFTMWNFPPAMSEAVIGHHGLRGAVLSVESAICSLADVLAVAMQYGSNGLGFVHAPYLGTWDVLGLPTGSIMTTILKSRRQINDILTIFGV